MAYFLAALIVRQLIGNWVVWQISENVRSGDMECGADGFKIRVVNAQPQPKAAPPAPP